MMVLAFLGGLAALAAGGELLIRSASRLATDLGVSQLFIGLTVVAFGTSAPEAVVSVVAALGGASDLAMGNVVGSNIFNVLFILGLSALIVPLAVSAQLVRFDVPVMLGVSGLCLLLGRDGHLGRWDGLLLLGLLVVHVVLGYRQGLRGTQGTGSSHATSSPSAPTGLPRRLPAWKARSLNVLIVLASLGLLVVGSRWLVASASALARWLGLSELVIGLTVVAAGTSLPEVATSIMAALRGERDIAVGNVVGSNIFNILGVLGLSAALAPAGLVVSPALLAFDLPVMVAVAALCLPIFFTGMAVARWEGGLLLLYFVAYTAYVVLRAAEHDALRGFAAAVTWIVLLDHPRDAPRCDRAPSPRPLTQASPSMNRVLVYSLLLVGGLVGSQLIPPLLGAAWPAVSVALRLATMVALAFVMIHVGYEFEVDRSRPRALAYDYGVAATAAAFPWIFVSVYFVVVLAAPGASGELEAWKPALLAGRFAAPTSAGVLFSMLAAAGLSATWMFRKARVLAIFDDLDTVLLMIPLKMLIVGLRWQMGAVVGIMAVQLWLAWRFFRRLRWSVRWPAVMTYAAIIVGVSEAIYQGSKLVDDVVPIHIEVLLPAFVFGCMLGRPSGADPHRDDAREGHQEGPEDPTEQRVAGIVSGVFMVLVGLSMPALASLLRQDAPGWGVIAMHVIAVTLLANLGKMFPALVYRREASWRERLAVSIGMWPRGEVGAGILILSLGYGIGGPLIVVAALSLALNLVLTGVFIAMVKRLLRTSAVAQPSGTRGG